VTSFGRKRAARLAVHSLQPSCGAAGIKLELGEIIDEADVNKVVVFASGKMDKRLMLGMGRGMCLVLSLKRRVRGLGRCLSG
jgi:hypothetical protein